MGPYDNEGAGGTGCYCQDPDWMEGQWLVDEEGALYIVPRNGDGVEGPDEDVSDTVLGMLRDNHADRLDEALIAVMGMTEVPDVLKRFSPEIGYYSA